MHCMHIDYLIISSIALRQNIEIHEVHKYLHPQCLLEMINITEANQLCTEQEIK